MGLCFYFQVMHQEKMVSVDNWVKFEALAKIAVLFRELRAEVSKLMSKRQSVELVDYWCLYLMYVKKSSQTIIWKLNEKVLTSFFLLIGGLQRSCLKKWSFLLCRSEML